MDQSITTAIRTFRSKDTSEVVFELSKEFNEIYNGLPNGQWTLYYPVSIDARKLNKKTAEMEEDLVFCLKMLWGVGEKNVSKKSRLLIPRMIDKKSDYLPILVRKPENSFFEIEFSRRDWLKNETYRSNVNFDGMAYYNAAIFSWFARREFKMTWGLIALAMKIVPFNHFVVPTPFWGSGENGVASKLNDEEQYTLWRMFCKIISDAEKNYKATGGRRYSSMDVLAEDATEKVKWLVEQIRGAYAKCRSAEKELLRHAGKGGSL